MGPARMIPMLRMDLRTASTKPTSSVHEHHEQGPQALQVRRPQYGEGLDAGRTHHAPKPEQPAAFHDVARTPSCRSSMPSGSATAKHSFSASSRHPNRLGPAADAFSPNPVKCMTTGSGELPWLQLGTNRWYSRPVRAASPLVERAMRCIMAAPDGSAR